VGKGYCVGVDDPYLKLTKKEREENIKEELKIIKKNILDKMSTLQGEVCNIIHGNKSNLLYYKKVVFLVCFILRVKTMATKITN